MTYDVHNDLKEMFLDKWFLIGHHDNQVRLGGFYGGKEIMTSPLINVLGERLNYHDAEFALEEGISVQTWSGSKYVLGKHRHGGTR